MSSKRILIVEDQADIRKLIRMTLAFSGCELYEAESGDSGYSLALHVQPQIMLLDVMMPGSMDGLQLCAKLKAEPAQAGIKIVLLSARGQQADLDAGHLAGADHYLIKPFSPMELMSLVEKLLQDIPSEQAANPGQPQA